MVYLVDVDVLLRATIPDAAYFAAASQWLDERLAGQAYTVGLAWPALVAYVEATTGRGLLQPPATADGAWTRVTGWLQAPAAWTPVPGTQHERLVGELLACQSAVGRSVWAVHMAALAVEHGLTITTANPVYQGLSVRHYNPFTGRWPHRHRPDAAGLAGHRHHNEPTTAGKQKAVTGKQQKGV